MANWKPVVFMNGDDSTRRGAVMVRDIVFPNFNFIDVDTGVEARLATNDQCIEEAAEALHKHRAGIKISTASNDPKIREKGWKSANIRLRPLAGCIGMYRQTLFSGGYKTPIAIMRFGSGDFYSEQSCKPMTVDGLDGHEIIQHFLTGDLVPMAEAAAARAKTHKLQMVVASKWTISPGEALLPDTCEQIFDKLGLKKGEWRGQGDYYREITDMCAAYIPMNVSPAGDPCPMSYDNGGWMIVTGNANGDTLADIADFQHGGNGMGSEVICRNGFSYFELPGGTAPGRKDSDFKGKKFFSPLGTLGAFTGAICSVNEAARPYCNAVLAAAESYINSTTKEDRCTQTMLEFVAKESESLL